MIDISVVIPAKNRAKTIKECLQSILKQTYQAREIIVVDDGSTDATRNVAENYAQQGVKVISLPHSKGAQHARNVGINAAKYAWIAFIDSDDIWLPDKLKLQVAALQDLPDYKTAIVCGDYAQWDAEQGIKKLIRIKQLKGEVFDLLLKAPGPTFQTLLAPKALLLKMGALDEKAPAYQEWDTAIRLARLGIFIHIPQTLFYWRVGEHDTISANKSNDIKGYQYIIDKYRAEMGETLYQRHQLTNLLRALRWGLFEQATALLQKQQLNQSVYKVVSFFAYKKVIPPAALRFLCRLLQRLGEFF